MEPQEEPLRQYHIEFTGKNLQEFWKDAF